ncbi:MAG: thioredoxin family protein [Gammaproteobacteria bacterium]|nr:thioredoxin family protein [Gammaproteobacteria bacterium]|tara:strand:- start:98056 stop:98298 length:243 start_codon:yes stop_codon:yes gene_type:complete
MRVLYFYTTAGCHLCDIAENMLRQQAVQAIQVELVDIIESEQLMQDYAERIPVLRFKDDDTELGWPFNDEVLRDFLQQQG